MLTRPLLLSALIAAFSLPTLAGCGGGDGAKPSSSSERGEEDGGAPKAKKPKKVIPAEPVAFATRPVTGEGRVPVDATVSGADGAVRLGDLLAGNSLVLYSDADTRNKQSRAAQRALRELSRPASVLGFRIVAVFTAGTTEKQIDDWYANRKIERTGRWAIDTDGAFAKASGWSPRSAALVGPDGQIGAFFPPTERWDARLGYEGGLTSDLLFRAWEAAEGAPPVAPDAKQAAVELVRGVLTGPPVPAEGQPTGEVPAALAAPSDRPVYVSIYRLGEVRRLRGSGTGANLGEAVRAATWDALRSAGDTAVEWQAAAADLRFAIDVLGPAQDLPTRVLSPLWYLVEPGIDGLVVQQGDGEQGVLLPHEPVTQGLLTPRVRNRDEKLKALLREASKRANLGKDAWREEAVAVRRFRATSFGVTQPGGSTAVDMVRGNVLVDGPPDEARILESLKLGGLWLVNTVREDGKFDYEYFPNAGKHSSGYNIVRHAGSVYGLFEMAELAAHEPALRADRGLYIDAAARAMGYIYDDTRSPAGDTVGDRRCLISDGRCESGSAALTLLTFLSRPDPADVDAAYRDRIFRAEDPEIMEGFGLALLDMIDKDGRVYFNYRDSRKYERVPKEPLYYPGETMLALLLFHKKTGDGRWLEGARRIGDRQVADYTENRFAFPDHWIMQGLHRLWQATREDRYAKTAYAMATHSASEQYPVVWTPFPDYHGAWRRDDDLPRTTRAGSRLEAVRRVVHLAWEDGHDATIWEDLLLMGTDHLSEKQYRPENMWYVPYPDKVIGAYPMGIVDNHLRIDNNQHALVGMLGALEVLRHRAGAK